MSAAQLRGEVATHFNVISASREGADPLRPHPSRQEPAISPVVVQPRNNHLTGVHLMGMHITGVHLMPVYLTGVHLMAVHLIGVYLMGVYLTGVHLMGVYLINVYLTGVHLIYESSLRVGQGW